MHINTESDTLFIASADTAEGVHYLLASNLIVFKNKIKLFLIP